jgi:tRNA A37 methylthiotransferase MiaB
MSKGRSRHQSSRRRMYSARQRELRERRARAAREDAYWHSDQVAAFEVEESLDFEAPASFVGPLRRRASAA